MMPTVLPSLIPTMSKLGKIFGVPEAELKRKFRAEDLEKVNHLLNISEGDDLEGQTVNMARVLGGFPAEYGNTCLWGDHYTG